MMGGRFLGIDGGGSSTRAFLMFDNETRMRTSGPSNVVVIGEQRAKESLEALLDPEEHFDAIVAGIAGADRPWVRSFWEAFLAPYSDVVWVMGDYRIAWAALTGGSPGLVAIFGTGSIFYGENRERTARVGGYGWKVGDVGSGIMLGQEALKGALADLEGWGPPSALTEVVLAWAGAGDKTALLNHIYHPDVDWRSVSDLAHMVFEAADAGDETAREILMQQAGGIIRYYRAATKAVDLPHDGPVGVAGGLASLWQPRLEPLWRREGFAPLAVVTQEPGEGALNLARRGWQAKSEGGYDESHRRI